MHASALSLTSDVIGVEDIYNLRVSAHKAIQYKARMDIRILVWAELRSA